MPMPPAVREEMKLAREYRILAQELGDARRMSRKTLLETIRALRSIRRAEEAGILGLGGKGGGR